MRILPAIALAASCFIGSQAAAGTASHCATSSTFSTPDAAPGHALIQVQATRSWERYYDCVNDCLWVASQYGQYATSLHQQWTCNDRCSHLRPQ